MDNRTEILNKRQEECITAIMNNGGSGTLVVCVAFGKSFVFYKWLYKLVEKGMIKKGDTVSFRSPSLAIFDNMKMEADKFSVIYGKNPLNDFRIIFHTFQSKLKPDCVVEGFDEFDKGLTQEYFTCLIGTKAKYRLYFSGTEGANKTVKRNDVPDMLRNQVFQSDKDTEAGKITKFITKGQLQSIICPVVYTYPMSLGIKEGILNKFDTVVIEHNPSAVNRLYPWKTKPTSSITEFNYYNWLERQKKVYTRPKYYRQQQGRKQANLIQDLPSKVPVAKKLIEVLEQRGKKTVLFGISRAPLHRITANTIWGRNNDNFVIGAYYYWKRKNKKVTHHRTNLVNLKLEDISKESYDIAKEAFHTNLPTYEELRNGFNSGDIRTLASSAKIERGVTLTGLDTCVFFSYFSTSEPLEQKIGRMLRYEEGKKSRLYIFVTKNTLEEKWFERFNKIYDEKGNIKDEIDLNIVKYVTSTQILRA